MRHSFLLIVMITVSLEPKWRHFAQVNIADIFMLSSKLPKQNESFFTSKQPASLSPKGSFSRASLADLKSRSKWIPSLAQKNSYSNGSDEYSYVESPVDAAIGQGASVENSMAPWVNAVMVKAA